jgi:hypothetical protein
MIRPTISPFFQGRRPDQETVYRAELQGAHNFQCSQLWRAAFSRTFSPSLRISHLGSQFVELAALSCKSVVRVVSAVQRRSENSSSASERAR